MEVSQLDRSRDVSGHKANMLLIDSTLDVFQFETPSSSVREEQKLNILVILATFDVSYFVKSAVVRFLQNANQ